MPKDTTRDNFDFMGLLHEAAGFPFAAEFDHVGFWDLRVAVAEKYQVGRVFIAGDAAHSHPPYGGFGLNNGLEDAVNLGWKLAARLQGWGGDALLPSYSEERRPIFHEVAEDFIAARIRNDGAFLARYNPARDKAEFEQAWKEQASDMDTRAQVYEPSYEGSPVVIGPPGGISTAHGQHVFKARAGHHLVPQKLSSGRDVFEELGRGFTLLAFDADDAAVRAFEQAAGELKVPLKVVRDSYADGRTKYETRMILVRPDQFIVWTGDSAPADAGPNRAQGRGEVMARRGTRGEGRVQGRRAGGSRFVAARQQSILVTTQPISNGVLRSARRLGLVLCRERSPPAPPPPPRPPSTGRGGAGAQRRVHCSAFRHAGNADIRA